MKNKRTGLKLSLLASSLLLISAANALDINQQGENIVFATGDQAQYHLTVKSPGGEVQSFTINNGTFTLSADTLGLKSLGDGQYKYELTPLPSNNNVAKSVRELGDKAVDQEYTKAFATNVSPQSGVFTISDNVFINPNATQELKSAVDSDADTRDQVILDDLIVDGSACIGFDCVNGESFGFDTLRLKENNLRIKFQDTSASASFPTNDWQITANDSANGGANKFSIDDIDGGRTPFTIEARAPTNSLYVDDGGRLGLGTSTPSVDLHIISGNTPTMRLEQNGSAGFSPQTWDVGGNEANFFIRDVTNGSALPFRIFPGAPGNAINIEATTGDVGLGVVSPVSSLHIKKTGALATIENSDPTQGGKVLVSLINNGNPQILMSNAANMKSWTLSAGQRFVLKNTAGNTVFDIDDSGNMRIAGTLTENHMF